MGSVDAEFLEQAVNGRRQRRRVWFQLRRKGFRVAEAGKVDGDHIEAVGQRGNNGVPGPPGRTQAVQQHKRRTGAAAGESQSSHQILRRRSRCCRGPRRISRAGPTGRAGSAAAKADAGQCVVVAAGKKSDQWGNLSGARTKSTRVIFACCTVKETTIAMRSPS